MIQDIERLVADSCDESAEGSIGLSGEVEFLDHGQEEFVAECLTPFLQRLCLGHETILRLFVSRDR